MKPHKRRGDTQKTWLALMIGNSRLHWATFVGEKLQAAWDTQHLPMCVVQKLANCRNLNDLPLEILPPNFPCSPSLPSFPCPIYLASVVPSQTEIWQAYPDIHIITLDQVPLQGVYPTLGIDRALALWGAGVTWSYPILVIDAGTALTYTGADANRHLVGGAILPGLGLQLQSLAQRTANLPRVEAQTSLPTRWALNTPESIYSGVIYTIIAGMRDFIEDWLQRFPESCICLTGGDGKRLLAYLRSHPQIATKAIFDPHLIFWGMQSLRACGSEKGNN